MATENRTPLQLDLTPEHIDRAGLITVNSDASARDLIQLADFLALQAAEIAEHWPTEEPMPMAMGEYVRQIQAVLSQLECVSRPRP